MKYSVFDFNNKMYNGWEGSRDWCSGNYKYIYIEKKQKKMKLMRTTKGKYSSEDKPY